MHLFCQSAIHDCDRSKRCRLAICDTASEKARDFLQRSLGRVESDSLRWFFHQCFKALERQCQMRTALRSGERVDLVDDYRACTTEHPATPYCREHDVQRLGS